ncbi:MAG TPA: IPT/TIG domain-containing protein [Bryobacteraceae bacterium]|nr:IPT/TIG domain-containing protein [Bryobacteraceae bacterium]
MNQRQIRCAAALLLLGFLAATPLRAQYTISVAAGTGRTPGSGDGGPATQANIDPRGVAVDGAGNLYLADNTPGRIRKVDPTGTITSIAGGGTNFPTSSSLPGSKILAGNLAGIAADSAGNVYFADDGALVVKLTPAGLGSAFSNLPSEAVAVDRAGNVYSSDGFAQVIKVTPAGVVTTVAGTGSAGYTGDNGPGVSAQLNHPNGMRVDSSGNVYIADTGNHIIRKVSPSGTITTVAGTPKTGGYLGDGGPATAAQLNGPNDVAVDGAGNLYIADSRNAVIRKVDTSGIITTIAGNGTGGESGDGGPALSAQLNTPQFLALDATGRIYFSDVGNARVRLLTPAQGAAPATITSLSPASELAGGPDFTVTVNGTNFVSGAAVQWNGASLATTFVSATQLSAQVSGSLIAAAGSARITVVNPGGTTSTAFTFTISVPLADPANGGYTISVAAGTGRTPYSGDNGPALQANMDPRGVAVDGAGNLYLADNSGGRIRKVNPASTITSIAGGGTSFPTTTSLPGNQILAGNLAGIAADSAGNVYFADDDALVVKLTSAGMGSAFSNLPSEAVTVDQAGNVYSSDGFAQIIKVTPAGAVTTVAGTGSLGYSGDNGPGVSAQLFHPNGMRVDSSGNVYIADTGNHIIRKVSPSGTIATVAGTPKTGGYLGDGGPATAAQLNGPNDVAVDGAGNLYIADSRNAVIRKVDTSGIITTIAGSGTGGESGDGGPALSAQLNTPLFLALDATGRIYFSDYGNARIRLLTPPAQTTPPATIASLQPSSASAGGPAFTLTVNGTNFVSGAAVQWNGASLATTFVSATQLTAQVPASLIAATGSASIIVVNPGATPTSALTFTINSQSPPPTCTPTGLLIQTLSPPSGFSAAVGQAMNIEVQLADNCGIVASGAATATFSNGDTAVQLAGIGQGNFAGAWAPHNPSQGGVVIQINAFETIGPGQILTTQVAISGAITSGQPQHLVTSVGSLNFSLSQGASAASQPLSIVNQGGGTAAFTIQLSGGAWLTVDSFGGNVSSSAPATVTVTVNPSGLAPGTYSGQILITSGTQSLPPVQVSATVSAAQPILLLSQTALSLTAAEGGGAPLPQDFGILNIGQGAMNWTAAASSQGGWLSLSSTSGTVNRPYLDVSTVNASVNPANLTAGTYYGQIQVTSPGFANLLQVISVVLTMLPRGTSPGPEVRPSGLIFTGPQNLSPGAQIVMISNPSASSRQFNSAAITLPGVSTWFTSTPPSTTIVPGQPAQVSVQPNFSGLSSGATRGAITLLFDDGTTRTIALLAVIPPAGTSGGGSLKPLAGGCTPAQINILNLQSSGSQQALSVSIGQPITIDVRVVDSCGQPVTAPGAVVATFSNGDPQHTLVHVGNGRWTTTWQPQKAVPANTPAAARVNAFLGFGTTIIGSQLDIPLAFGAPSSVAIVDSGGVLNAASFAGSSPVAPGSLITIFGAHLANGSPGQQATVPLPTQLGNTQVLMAGRSLPLLYASDGQVNAQVPFDLPVDVPSQLVVQIGSALSVPEPVLVAPAQPAVFTTAESGQGQGAIVNGITNVVADSSAPVTAGDTVVIYCTGLGAVNPPVPLGTAANGPTPTVQPVTATIGGNSATVNYAGLAPGFPGLYQVNAVVPNGIAPSGQVPVVLMTAGQTSPAVTIAVR